MDLIKCPNCKRKVNTDLDRCPYCTYELTQETKAAAVYDQNSSKQKKIVALVISGSILLVVLAISAFFIIRAIKENNEKKLAEQQAIQAEQQAIENEKREEEEKERKSSKFITDAKNYSDVCQKLHSAWFDYSKKKRKIWYNCIMEIDDSGTDKYTKKKNGKFRSDFNEALSKWVESDDMDYFMLNQECSEKVSSESVSYGKLSHYEPTNQKETKIKNYISDIHEIVLNMKKYDESYGYNYTEYDNKMDDYLSSMSDLQTKLQTQL